jgi:hypothetical protein
MPYTENCSFSQAATPHLRSRCRNPQCRLKLLAPVENEHHAFCCRGCFDHFYRSRCLVCEEPMRRKREGQKLGSGHKVCEREYRKFPRVYGFPVPTPTISDESLRSAHSTGLKIGIKDDRPSLNGLAHHRWGGDPDHGDHSLYDQDGLTVARLVLESDGRYHLRSPVTTPRMSWPNLGQAQHAAELLALAALPLDPKLAAQIAKNNSASHPMGPPLNRQPSCETAIASDWRPAAAEIPEIPDIPEFLRRTKHVPSPAPERPALCRPVSGRRTQSHSWPSLASQNRTEAWVALRLGRGNP